jgi:tetraacyldisaccharide 4'-kinase
MSRGYKRKSRGFQYIQRQDTVEKSGDEPLLYKRKYPDVAVTVSESRALGVPKLMQAAPDTQVLLLDDAFQHREIKPYLNILLTTYERPFYKDWILPSGTLRENRSAYKRADAILVTKCPEDLKIQKAEQISSRIKPGNKPVFFTTYNYGLPYYLFDGRVKLDLTKTHHLIMVSGIANPDYMEAYLQNAAADLYRLDFRDHHDYTNYDLAQIHKAFKNLEGEKKAIITTEKDAVKLERHRPFIIENKLPLFVLPIQVSFLFDRGESFNSWIKNKLLEFKV